ncbi:MAG: phosphatase PAP2 family protein [Oricola sp.]
MTTRRLWGRLSRPVSRDMPPVWSGHMTSFAVASTLLTMLAVALDPYAQPFAHLSTNGVLRFMSEITDAAKSGWYIVPAIIIIAIIGLTDWRRLRTASRRALMSAYGEAAFILVSISVSGIVVNIIKQFVGRARPRMADEFGVYGFWPFHFDSAFQGFPSGHAATAGSLAVILMLWHPKARWALLALMFLLACARIPAGAHYPSDVVAGFSLAAIMTLAFARWLARRRAVFVFDGDNPFPRLIR